MPDLASIATLRDWTKRMRSRRELRNLCDLNCHILQDIGLTKTALQREIEKPFWR
jgi:uncharacterized protein YjiS (DUF1127 family)